jgi:ferric enterobactin receptor
VRYHRNDDDVITDYDLQLDYSNASRLPAYFRIDVATSYSIPFKNSGKLELALSIHNVTNHTNIKTRRIDTDELSEAVLTNTELLARYNDVVLLGFSPTFSVHVSF